jgi:hypothetical protein
LARVAVRGRSGRKWRVFGFVSSVDIREGVWHAKTGWKKRALFGVESSLR